MSNPYKERNLPGTAMYLADELYIDPRHVARVCLAMKGGSKRRAIKLAKNCPKAVAFIRDAVKMPLVLSYEGRWRFDWWPHHKYDRRAPTLYTHPD